MSSSQETKFAYLSENKGLGDLRSKSNVELKELLERQNHLLLNKSLINKLKDKGEKIRKVRNEIASELEYRVNKNNVTIEKSVKSSTAVEWKETNVSGDHSGDNEHNHTIDMEKDTMKILSQNGEIPIHNKSHITRLLEKEKEPNFSFKPYNPAVAEKVKKIVPDAHTTACSSLAKTIHLEESLNLLSQQMSALKILGSRSKRVEECIEDRMNDIEHDQEQDIEEVDDDETKVGLGISVNVSN